jgi:hypothetical protein
MASLEFQSKIPAPEQRVGNEPERRNGTEETGLDQTIMKADDGVQTVQLQSLFDAKDENTKYESERIVVALDASLRSEKAYKCTAPSIQPKWLEWLWNDAVSGFRKR